MRTAMIIGLLTLLVTSPGRTTPVTLSGQVTYDGSYDSAQSLYVILIDTQTETLVCTDTLTVAGTPFVADYSLTFDNAGLSSEAGVFALLDVDNSGSGVDIDGLGTPGDVIGYHGSWESGTYEPEFVSPSVSQTGLDFALPKAEIHGYATFVDSRAPVHIEACSCPGHWCPWVFDLSSSGDYSLIIYAGEWFVRGVVGDYQDSYCYVGAGGYCDADPECTALTLDDETVLTGIDITIHVPSPIETQTWGRIKAGYGR